MESKSLCYYVVLRNGPNTGQLFFPHRLTHTPYDYFLSFFLLEEKTAKTTVYCKKGCGCDVAAHWYSLSTDLNPEWESYYVGQPELCAYWEGLWRKYDLVSHTKLSTSVSSAEWDGENHRYKVVVKDEKSKEESVVEAEIVIWAIGGFFDPLYPKELESGLGAFKGTMFHSARWRHDVELRGKRVGVIGNGCSA
jgi:cation diffusion facilitator CzcD-associated flavoprotein CzcO